MKGVNECRQKPRMIRYADDLVMDVGRSHSLHPSGCLWQSVSPRSAVGRSYPRGSALCRSGEGRGMKERLARWLPFGPEIMAEGQSRGLALHEAKTRVRPSRASGCKFLGFSFRWQQSKKGTPSVHTELYCPSS